MGSGLTLGNELSKETHVLTRGFIGKENLGGEQEGKGTQENCSAAWLGFYGDGISFRVVFGQSF